MSITNVAQFKQFIDAMIGNDKWVVGGSFAIDFWCAFLNIGYLEEFPKNVDILYSRMTPLTFEKFGAYKRLQSTPHSSMTFQNGQMTPINLTMTRSTIKYYEVEGVKLISPASLIMWYEDDDSINSENKKTLLREIIFRTENMEFNYIYSRDPIRADPVEHNAKRRLIIS